MMQRTDGNLSRLWRRRRRRRRRRRLFRKL